MNREPTPARGRSNVTPSGVTIDVWSYMQP
jgi:hypothetical protein